VGTIFGVLLAQLPAFLLASLRVGVTFAAMPAPFGAVTPARIRLALSMLVTFVIWSSLGSAVRPEIGLEPVALLRAAVLELLVGSVIGMTVRVTLASAEIAGSAIGQSVGLGFAGTVDPTQGESVLPTTQLLSGIAMLIFFSFEGHHALFAALATSFRAAPIGHELSSLAYGGVIQLTSGMLARGLQISAPVVATMFIVQLGTALASRTAPRVHLFAFSFSVLVAAGSLAIWVAAPSLCTAIGAEIRRLPELLASVVGAA
jgi:flagellar biosynthetic protein FliR